MEIINRLIAWSLRNRMLVLVATVALVLTGGYAARNMAVDVFPDLTAPTVVIMTDAEGMAAEEVERLVTFPLETAVNGASDVRRVRSASMQGVSFVWTEFDWGTDIYKARQVVAEKLAALESSLPQGVTPVIAPQSSVMGEILFIGLSSDTTSMMDLRTIADWVIKPAILATGGVSQVTNIGGEVRQYQILADPRKMAHYGVTLADIEQVGSTFSANSTGNVVRQHGNEYTLRGVARTSDLDDLRNSPVRKADGSTVFLSQVADVVVAPALRMGNATRNAAPAVILSVSKQPNINTLEVTEAIERNLAEIRKTLPADVVMDTRIFRQADFIQSSVDNVADSLLEGALFAVIIIFIFLASWRTTLISVIAIPLSLLGTCIVLWALRMDINTMTLGGMCLAIGSLVDDAIIDVENVYRRLRHNYSLPPASRRSTFDVVYSASAEIRSSILNATLIIIVAFMPLFFLSGMEGRMLKPLGIAYIISLFMSLVVAMTVTPLLCKDLLGTPSYLVRKLRESWTERFLGAAYSRSLLWTLRHKTAVIASTVAAFAVAVVLFFSMGQAFLPDFNEGSAVISAVVAPGVSLDVNDELGYVIERQLLSIPEVTGTARRTGRGDLDEHSQATNGSEIEVQFKLDGRSREQVFEQMREKLAAVPGVVTTVGQPLGHRIDHILSGTRANIAIKVFGTDLSRLYMIGNEIKGIVEKVPGAVDVAVEQQVETPQIQIRAKREALAARGITIDEFNSFVRMAFSGEAIGDIYEGERRFDVILKLDNGFAGDVEEIKSSLISGADGRAVPLEEVADIVSASGPGSITRENVQRKLVVSANVSGRDVGSVVNEIRESVGRDIPLPQGYRIEYGGQFESARSASLTLIAVGIFALAVIFLLLYGEFRTLGLSALVMLNLPFSLIGGVVAVYFTSGYISIPGIIGFITLFGVATRNGILLVSRYRHLAEEGMGLHRRLIKGSADRLDAILMTALSTGLALIPLIINGDKPGNEIQSPMAVVVLGGLVTSTILNIYVMPVVYELYCRRRGAKKNRR